MLVEQTVDRQSASAAMESICCVIVQSGHKFASRIDQMLNNNNNNRNMPNLASPAHEGRGRGADSAGGSCTRVQDEKAKREKKIAQ